MEDNQVVIPQEFQSTMRLLNFVLSIFGFLVFTFICAIYLYKIDIRKVDKQNKVIIGLLMLFSVVQLVSNSIKFSLKIDLSDSDLETLGKILTSIGIFALFLMLTIQFLFVKEMGDVYIKIIS